FIAVAVTAAFLCLERARTARTATSLDVLAGALVGVAFVFTYNAIAYIASGGFALLIWRRLTPAIIASLTAGFLLPVAAFAVWFGAAHGLRDLYDATITYNVKYSGET